MSQNTETSRRPRVMVVTASVGAGHNSAARAIVAVLTARAPQVDVEYVDVLTQAPWAFRAYYAGVYALAVTRAPWAYGLGYAMTNRPHRPGRGLMERRRLWTERWALKRFAARLLDDPPTATVPTVSIDRRLDFAAVTDHAGKLGERRVCLNPQSAGYQALVCKLYRGDIRLPLGDTMQPLVRLASQAIFGGNRSARVCSEGGADCRLEARNAWEENQRANELWNDTSADCSFTTFHAYEYTLAENASNTGKTREKVAKSPPAITDSVPLIAPSTPPETGASTQSTPDVFNRSAMRRVTSGLTVEASIRTSPRFMPDCTCSITASRSSSAETQTNTILLFSANSAGEPACIVFSSAARLSSLSAERFQTPDNIPWLAR